MGARTVAAGRAAVEGDREEGRAALAVHSDGNDLTVEDDGSGFETGEGGFERGDQVVAGPAGQQDGSAVDLQGAHESDGHEVGDGARDRRGALREEGAVAVTVFKHDGADRSGLRHSGLILGRSRQQSLNSDTASEPFPEPLSDIGQKCLFQGRAEGNRGVRRSHADDRAVEILEDALGDADGQFAGEARGARVLVHQQHLRRLPDAGADRLAIERQEGAQIHHFDRRAVFLGQLVGGFERASRPSRHR